MKVNAISNPIYPKRNNNVNFGRKLREEEKPEYSKAIHDALDYLGVQNLSMIVHGSSFPSEKRKSKSEICLHSEFRERDHIKCWLVLW